MYKHVFVQRFRQQRRNTTGCWEDPDNFPLVSVKRLKKTSIVTEVHQNTSQTLGISKLTQLVVEACRS